MRLGGTFDYAARKERLEEVNRELESPELWNDPERAQAMGKERARLEQVVATIEALDSGLSDAGGLLELAAEEQDADTAGEVSSDLDALEGRVFAKTGTITHVNSLSGYLVTESGHELIFSIFTNGSGLSSRQVRSGIDRILEVVARR